MLTGPENPHPPTTWVCPEQDCQCVHDEYLTCDSYHQSKSMKLKRFANLTNGICFPHDDVCYFQSNYGHQYRLGYFKEGAMPYSAILHLLGGGKIEVIDATRHGKLLTDALRFGVTTWVMVFNRAVCGDHKSLEPLCPWETPEMRKLVASDTHEKLIQDIRKFAKIVPFARTTPLTLGLTNDFDVKLTCHHGFTHDDNPRRIRKILTKQLGKHV